MDCVSVTTELVDCDRRQYNVYKNDYKLDIWHELRKRWMIIGVLIAMTLAVLSPKFGAPGGPLAAWLSLVAQWVVYYTAGRRARAGSAPLLLRAAHAHVAVPALLVPQGPLAAWLSLVAQWVVYYTAGRRARAGSAPLLLGAAHAHVAVPALLAATAAWLRDVIDYRVLNGALLSSIGPPCAWLSLVVARDAGAALTMLAVNYVTSLVAAPITMFLVCGRAPIPAIGPTLWAALCTIPPLTAGAAHTYFSRSHSQRSECSECSECFECSSAECSQHLERFPERLAALTLVYVDFCERIATAGAGLHVSDVLSTVALAVWCVSASALICVLYGKLGLSADQVHLLAVCAVPKAMHTGWQSSVACVPAGLARLGAACAAPAQALLAAAAAPGGSARRGRGM